jgi:hypothetical protein
MLLSYLKRNIFLLFIFTNFLAFSSIFSYQDIKAEILPEHLQFTNNTFHQQGAPLEKIKNDSKILLQDIYGCIYKYFLQHEQILKDALCLDETFFKMLKQKKDNFNIFSKKDIKKNFSFLLSFLTILQKESFAHLSNTTKNYLSKDNENNIPSINSTEGEKQLLCLFLTKLNENFYISLQNLICEMELPKDQEEFLYGMLFTLNNHEINIQFNQNNKVTTYSPFKTTLSKLFLRLAFMYANGRPYKEKKQNLCFTLDQITKELIHLNNIFLDQSSDSQLLDDKEITKFIGVFKTYFIKEPIIKPRSIKKMIIIMSIIMIIGTILYWYYSPMIKQELQKASNNLHDLWQNIKEKSNLVYNRLFNEEQVARNMMRGALDEAQNRGGDINQIFDPLLQNVNNRIDQSIQNVDNRLQNIENQINNHAQARINQANNHAQNLVDQAHDQAQDLLQNDIQDVIDQGLQEANHHAQARINQINGHAENRINQVHDNAQNLLQNEVPQVINDGLQQVNDHAENRINQVHDNAQNLLQNEVPQVINDGLQQVNDHAENRINQVHDNAQNLLQNEVPQVINDGLQQVNDLAENRINQAHDHAQNLIQNEVSQVLDDGLQEVNNHAQARLGQVDNIVQSRLNQAGNIAQDQVQQFDIRMHNLADRATNRKLWWSGLGQGQNILPQEHYVNAEHQEE